MHMSVYVSSAVRLANCPCPSLSVHWYDIFAYKYNAMNCPTACMYQVLGSYLPVSSYWHIMNCSMAAIQIKCTAYSLYSVEVF